MTLETLTRKLLKRDISFPETRNNLERLRAISKGNDIPLQHEGGMNFEVYTSIANVTLEFMEQLSPHREFAELEDLIRATHEAYEPSYPPTSPVTTSFYNSSLLFDVSPASCGFTIGELFINYLEERCDMRYAREPLQYLNASRLGFYQVSGIKRGITYLWDIHNKKEYACRCATGYRGTEGEVWYVRILPPLKGREEQWTVLCTPYVFRKTGRDHWKAFFSRETAGKPEGHLEDYLKYGRYPGYWMEFVFQAYVNHSKRVIYLEGLPDDVESRPHGELDGGRLPSGKASFEDNPGPGLDGHTAGIQSELQKLLDEDPNMDLGDLNAKISQLALKKNNSGLSDFDGLSPAEMQEILYHPFEPGGTVGFNREISETECEAQCPFYRMTKMLLTEIERQGTIKVTAKGNLPGKYVKEWYGTGISPFYPIDTGISKLKGQDDWLFLDAVVKTAKAAGWIKIVHGKLSLTKKGEGLLRKKSNALFYETLKIFCEKFNWAYYDKYSSEYCGQFGFLFSLWLLKKHGKKKQTLAFYGDKYFTAFPQMKDSVDRVFGEDHSQSCYGHRFFSHFCVWFGLGEMVKTQKDNWLPDVKKEVTDSSFLTALITGRT